MKVLCSMFIGLFVCTKLASAAELQKTNQKGTSTAACVDMATRLAYNVQGEHGNLNMGMTHELKTAENKADATTDYIFTFKVGGGEIEKVKVTIYYSPQQQKCYLSSLSLL